MFKKEFIDRYIHCIMKNFFLPQFFGFDKTLNKRKARSRLLPPPPPKKKTRCRSNGVGAVPSIFNMGDWCDLKFSKK